MNMYARYVSVFFLGIFLLPVAMFADTASTTGEATGTPPTQIEYVAPKEPLRSRMGSTTELMKARIIERRSLLADNVKYRVKNLFDNVYNRMQATVARFEHITTRIESRMVKMEALGIDTTSAHANLLVAKNETALAKELLLKNTDRDVDVVIDGTSPAESFATLRRRVISTVEHLKLAHTALTTTISTLKVAPVQSASSVEATSSPATDE